MTRVLHVLEAAGFGTGEHLLGLVDHVDAEHHVALPAVRHRRGEQALPTVAPRVVATGATVHPVPMRRVPTHPQNVAALRALDRLVRRLRPDVVHGHSSIGGALGRLVARRHGVPAVWTPHGLRPDAATIGVERRLARLTDRLVAVSPSEADQVVRLGLAPPDRVRTILNGIVPTPPPAADPGARDLFALGDDVPLVGYVGRLGREKGIDLLVDALDVLRHDLPEVHAVLVAVGPGATAFDRDLERRGLAGRVHRLPGWPTAAALMPDLDVLAVPSRREAGPALVALEAMRVDVPVVCTDVVGLRDAVDDGTDGLLVPAGDVGALAAALGRVLGDRSLAARLAAAARERLRTRHDLSTFAARHAALYDELA